MTIKVKIVADSISEAGKRITTFQLYYPLMIHAELMTHRVFSRNAASNRAIPVAKLAARTRKDPAIPMSWGSKKAGMQAGEDLPLWKQFLLKSLWLGFMYIATFGAKLMDRLGLHKQHSNRLMMPFQHIDVIVTSTEWGNFFDLRISEAAQPEIYYLAKQMRLAIEQSKPKLLELNEWHLPYVDFPLDIEEGILISAARCARVSYLNHEGKLDEAKDLALAKTLKSMKHMSPFEHQATPMKDPNTCSNNFIGWYQYRAELEYPLPMIEAKSLKPVIKDK